MTSSTIESLEINRDQTHFLHWTQRPESLQQKIHSAFSEALFESPIPWCTAIYPNYVMCGVRTHHLMFKLIEEGYPDQKEFTALAITAGSFEWGRALAYRINENTNLPSDIHVNILNVRLEMHPEFFQQIYYSPRCTVANFSSFHIEEMEKCFAKKNLDLLNSIDLIVFPFFRAADPVGTFVQAYNLLRPRSGMMVIDGFRFGLKGAPTPAQENALLIQLFLDTHSFFLTLEHFANTNYGVQKQLNQFILRRPSDAPCELPMQYVDASNKNKRGALFTRTPQHDDEPLFISSRSYSHHFPNHQKIPHFQGSKLLYEWLKQQHLLEHRHSLWRPLRKQEEKQAFPLIHTAIINHDWQAFDRLVEQTNANESDLFGNTPLHIAIFSSDLHAFHRLMREKLDLELCNEFDCTPLHLAANKDFSGILIRSLVEAGAKINRISIFDGTPLDLAINAKNEEGIIILIRAEARIAQTDPDELIKICAPLIEKGVLKHQECALAELALPLT